MTDSSTTSPPVRIALDPQESLPDLLARVRELSGRAVEIEIPDHSPILLTATEFRTLGETAARANIRLTLITEDRLRIQLANMFGLVKDEPVAHETEGWRPEPTALGSPRSFGTWRDHRRKETSEPPVIDASSMAPPRRRRRTIALPTEADGIERSDGSDDEIPESESAAAIGAFDYLDDDPGRRARLIARAVAVVLVILLIGGIAGWFYYPTVTVRATLKQASISTQFIYVAAAKGASTPPDAAFTVAAQQGSATVPFTVSVPATGTAATPKDKASGSVTLRNPTGDAITVPAGSKLADHAGVTYDTTDEVKVPAAKDDGATPGEATVNVVAEKGGTDGNQDPGHLTGKIANLDIYFSNRDDAIGGGTDRTVKVITQQDLDGMKDAVTKNLARAAADGWQSTLTGGQAIVPQSVTPQNQAPDYTVKGKVGDQSDTVSATGTVPVTGLIFTQSDVTNQSIAAATKLLTPNVPQGYALKPDTITFGEPQVLAQASDSVQFNMTATATVQAVFDAGQQKALARQIAGKGWNTAKTDVSAQPAFATSSISRSPGWWPERMPQSSDRVKVEIDTTVANQGTPTPAPSGGGS